MKDKLKWLVKTKMGWMLISIVWFIVFRIIDTNIESDWAFWVSMPAAAYLVGLFLVMMAYAFVINPIRDYKEKEKFKNNLKKDN
jgi:uncharacterized membrane protein